MSQQSRLSSYFGCSSGTDTVSDTTTTSSSNSSTSSTRLSASPSVSACASRHCSKSSALVPLTECPVNALDPADATGHLLSLSRDYKWQLVQLGPCQPRRSSYPIHQHNDGQKRSFQAKWFDLPCSKEWLEYSTKCSVLLAECSACSVVKKRKRTGYRLV